MERERERFAAIAYWQYYVPCQPKKTIGTTRWSFCRFTFNFFFHQIVQVVVSSGIRLVFFFQPLKTESTEHSNLRVEK